MRVGENIRAGERAERGARKGLFTTSKRVGMDPVGAWRRLGAGHGNPWARRARRAGAEPGESERMRQWGPKSADPMGTL